MDDVLDQLAAWQKEGRTVAVATVVKTSGSTPRSEGAKLLVTDAGEIAGSVSGGCVEGDVASHAMEVLRDGRPRLVSYGISDEAGIEVGLACGGSIEVLIEGAGNLASYGAAADARRQETPASIATIVRPAARLGERALVVGGRLQGSAGDGKLDSAVQERASALLRQGVSRIAPAVDSHGEEVEIFYDSYPAPPTLLMIPLTKYAKILGYRVTVIDPRGVFATRERFADADELIIQQPADYLAGARIHENTSVVVLTHDPKLDEPVIKLVLNTDAAYLGAIGSRKTNEDRNRRLQAEGVSAEAIARMHAPIGLDIGSKTPEEIALAIMAEVVAARYGKAGPPLRSAALAVAAS
ncbi:MAG: XshC-Cox1 family protein [Chloroflexi bacterium]|nr:XshC-Cox1 family protein [Chloroflexota bacterium]